MAEERARLRPRLAFVFFERDADTARALCGSLAALDSVGSGVGGGAAAANTGADTGAALKNNHTNNNNNGGGAADGGQADAPPQVDVVGRADGAQVLHVLGFRCTVVPSSFEAGADRWLGGHDGRLPAALAGAGSGCADGGRRGVQRVHPHADADADADADGTTRGTAPTAPHTPPAGQPHPAAPAAGTAARGPGERPAPCGGCAVFAFIDPFDYKVRSERIRWLLAGGTDPGGGEAAAAVAVVTDASTAATAATIVAATTASAGSRAVSDVSGLG